MGVVRVQVLNMIHFSLRGSTSDRFWSLKCDIIPHSESSLTAIKSIEMHTQEHDLSSCMQSVSVTNWKLHLCFTTRDTPSPRHSIATFSVVYPLKKKPCCLQATIVEHYFFFSRRFFSSACYKRVEGNIFIASFSLNIHKNGRCPSYSREEC